MKKNTWHRLYKTKHLLILLSLVTISTSKAQLFNSKPTSYPDTCRGNIINVLTNDKDDNGDSLTVTKFNGRAITNTGQGIEKPDTGTFILTVTGNLTCIFKESFYGNVYLTYYVNDGKGSTAKRQNGTIIIIREPAKGEIACLAFHWQISDNDSCKYHTGAPRYWVSIIGAGDTTIGFLAKEKIPQVGGAYEYGIVEYKHSKQSDRVVINRWYISEMEFLFIKDRACLK